MTAAVRTAGGLPVLLERRGLFEAALTQLADLDSRLAPDAGTAPDAVSVASALRQVELAYQAVRRALAAAEAEYKEAEARRKDAALALERSNRGLAELNPEVARLQRELTEAGIDCTPVCDLVRISAPAWQPVIDAATASQDTPPRDPAGFSAWLAGELSVPVRWPPPRARKRRR